MAFIIGLDLGQSMDYSALVVVECQGTVSPHYAVRHLHRWPLQTSYPSIVQDVAGAPQAARPDRPELACDGSDGVWQTCC